jgi:hypothetical protein
MVGNVRNTMIQDAGVGMLSSSRSLTPSSQIYILLAAVSLECQTVLHFGVQRTQVEIASIMEPTALTSFQTPTKALFLLKSITTPRTI